MSCLHEHNNAVFNNVLKYQSIDRLEPDQKFTLSYSNLIIILHCANSKTSFILAPTERLSIKSIKVACLFSHSLANLSISLKIDFLCSTIKDEVGAYVGDSFFYCSTKILEDFIQEILPKGNRYTYLFNKGAPNQIPKFVFILLKELNLSF